MKIGIILATMVLMASVIGIGWSAVYENKCSDGTGYWQCSQTQPGYACLPDSASATGLSLQNDVANKLVQDSKTGMSKCACANFAGYAEVDGACVKTTCVDGSKTLQAGECSSTKPKRCTSGSLVDDPTACGCPEGKKASSDGKSCEVREGCRWGTSPCEKGYNCSYVESNTKDDGHCVAKKGCSAYIPSEGKITCTSMQECDSSTNPDGVCITKQGCKYSNPACGTGKVCDMLSNTCESSDVVSATTIKTTKTANSAVSDSSNLSCCCLPTAGIVGLAGIAIARRKKEE
ncbi:MAG: hypothetical protein WC492_02550 [Candidatus Micrarchaeia archaeon]